jgi:acyl carrier protein
MSLVHEISILVRDVLVLGAGAENFDANTGLLGSIPEFDSMAVVSIITALEDEYGFVIEDDEISADVFATIGSLAGFVEQKLG